LKITGTLDIECASWDRFAVAATYKPGVQATTIHRSIASLVDFLLSHPKSTWWAHCGGSYDFLAIAEELRRREIPSSVDLAGSRVSRIVAGGITLRDSWPLVPLPLEIAAGLAGERAPSLDLACTCGRACGGYCAIRPADPRKRVADYCAADARVLYRVLVAVREIGETMGLELRGTLGGTAWATAKKAGGLPDADLPPVAWRRVRSAYFGGRVTILRPRATGPGSHWDINSAYPAALAKTSVPCGEWSTYQGREARACLANACPGIYACEVHVPEILLPPLPVRIGSRVAYPIGTIRGAWTLLELETAVRRGCEVKRVAWAMVWERSTQLFAPLIQRWWKARAKAGKKSPLGQWLRLLPNSLTGKLAEGPERQTAKLFPDVVKLCTRQRPCSPIQCVGVCGAMEQMDLWGQVWASPFYRPATSGHIQWAAYLTAETRAQWLTGAESQGMDLVYGDTDSIWTTSRHAPQPSGARLGDWEYKHAWSDFECAAPRTYQFRDARTDESVQRTAGASLSPDEWKSGNASSDRGVLSFSEAAAKSEGLFIHRTKTWTLPTRGRDTGWYGDRKLDPEERITLPMSYGEIEKAASRVQESGTNPKGDQ
jgi:DNA polymerase type B, organellar and viral